MEEIPEIPRMTKTLVKNPDSEEERIKKGEIKKAAKAYEKAKELGLPPDQQEVTPPGPRTINRLA